MLIFIPILTLQTFEFVSNKAPTAIKTK